MIQLEWRTADFNFDDLPQAWMTLFVVASFEGWLDVMYDAVDATDVDMQPVFMAHPEAAAFFVIFIIVGSFMFLNLFVSVIFINYHETKQRDSGFSNLDDLQVRLEFYVTICN